MLAYNLTSAGYEAVQASDGHEALQLIDGQPPDLVLRDWMLPGISGIRICRQLKVRKNTRAILIIILSARSWEVDIVRGSETLADEYLRKTSSVQNFW